MYQDIYPSSDLFSDDAIIKAHEWHEILFENPWMMVLYGHSKPGGLEPFHTHQWKHLMLILKESQFKMEQADGTIEIDSFPIGGLRSFS